MELADSSGLTRSIGAFGQLMTELSMDESSHRAHTPAASHGLLSRRLLVLILCCSTLFTLIATVIQLYLEYRADVENMNENVSFIQSSYVPALSRSLYELNDEQLDLQLNGALQLSDIVHLTVLEETNGQTRERSVGSTDYTSWMIDEFELAVDVAGEPFKVGTLIVASSTDNITRRVFARAANILTINATKTFIVAFLMLWIIQAVVTRHIQDMADWVDSISLSSMSEAPFVLNRRSNANDELQQVAGAMNAMRERIAADITEREKLQAETRQLTIDLHHSEKLQAIGELAGGIAHDFNNQLHIIMANADLLKEQFPNSEAAAQFAENIIRSCTNSSDLIANLMKFSRKDAQDTTTVHLNALVTEVSNLLRLGASSQHRIILDIRANRDQIEGDISLLQNALLNMGLNARDALYQSGEIRFETENCWLEANTLETGPAEAGSFVKVSIVDTGSGLDEETLKRIFEPFFTTKLAGKGTGMGLAAVYSTVQLHDAMIEVSSRVGEGTRFDLYFPSADLNQRLENESA